jgi:mRNA-degrading endonuclease RelE of RelBE toxin-antitoxin system
VQFDAGEDAYFLLEARRQWRIVCRMWSRFITVAETLTFIRQAERVWSDEERETFIDFIAKYPDSGDIIPGTGGVRKVRWSKQGSGKRGGTRVIYFFYDQDAPLYLLMVYTKGAREDISPEAKKLVREFALRIKQANRRYEEWRKP